MGLITQIGSDNQAKTIALRDMLIRNDIHVTHPSMDEFSISESNSWSAYEQELELFNSITRTSFHIIFNTNGTVTEEMAQQIMFAMLHQKPVVFVYEPVLDNLSTFARELIAKHRQKFFVTNILALDRQELQRQLNSLPQEVSYGLVKPEATMCSFYGKTHFRQLLEAAQAKAEAAFTAA